MYSVSTIMKKRIIGLLVLSFAVLPSLAQNMANASPKTTVSGSNQLVFLLTIIAGVLAFVIWGMGSVLIQLSRQVLQKQKEEKKSGITSAGLVTGFLLLSQIGFAQNTTAEVVKEIPNYGGLSAMGFWMFIGVIGMEVIAIAFILFMIKRIQAELLPAKVRKQSSFNIWWSNIDKKLFTKAVPVEKEADVLLDHNYDGIRELDNALPPWWKYGFYITIVVGVVYLFHFHVFGTGKNPTEEYAAEMNRARIQQEFFDSKNKDRIDEKNVPMADAAGLARAKEMYAANCVACHGPQGGGGAGPNLTDDYWIHKGSLNDIYQSIKTGYPLKGMQSWLIKFNPKEISLLASYIKSLHGTNPAGGLPPNGDFYSEEVKAPADSLSAKKTDSLSKSKTDTLSNKTK